MDAKAVLAMIKEKDVKFVDFRFTDPRGKWQHTARMASATDEGTFADGVMFDGSSIAGWKAINESDMILMPDPATAVLDPFSAQTTLIISCDVVEPSTGQLYARCPRSTAKRAEAFMKSSGIGDTAVFGPELEFFVFDDVRFDVQMQGSFYRSLRANRRGTPAPSSRAATWAIARRSRAATSRSSRSIRMNDLRAEMMSVCDRDGPRHGNPSPRGGAQPERARLPLRHAREDRRQRAEVQVHPAQRRPQLRQVADLHAEAALWRQRLGHAHPPVDLEGQQAAVRRFGLCRSLRDGALLHRRHHQARQGAQRLLQRQHQLLQARHPGFEAPVLLAYSSRNRSASCRIPYASSPKGKRVEVRFPDPSANPYLAFAAMLMAGLDGIQNKIHPGDPMDKNLYDLPPEELSKVRPSRARCARR
jgi:glutamine synthetase